jgi:hypothetical protein
MSEAASTAPAGTWAPVARRATGFVCHIEVRDAVITNVLPVCPACANYLEIPPE